MTAQERPFAAAVTGTNGKTSVVEFTRQILSADGMRAASLGGLGLTVTGWGREPEPAISEGPEGDAPFCAQPWRGRR